MRLATLRAGGKSTTAALDLGADGYLPLPYSGVGALLADPAWRTVVEVSVRANGAAGSPSASETIKAGNAEFAPLVPDAGKVICCGLNYGDHILEMGRDLPEYPTLFAKHADTLAGAGDVINVWGSEKVDWEAELAVVVGRSLFRADEEQAHDSIAGYTVANDVSMRDWQNRTLQWFQGKAFDATTPVGPVLVTPEETSGTFEVRGYVNGELVQSGNTDTLVFSPARLLSYISQFTILRPGDLVLTGTPGGVGMGMTPPRFLQDGDVLTTEIEGIGRLENSIRIHSNGAADSRTAVATTTIKE
jgi:2-keto-4-pentenoate hydratase/2-oxohepta-3-ene-1,7-dioic acid hydratase in catechol pathway